MKNEYKYTPSNCWDAQYFDPKTRSIKMVKRYYVQFVTRDKEYIKSLNRLKKYKSVNISKFDIELISFSDNMPSNESVFIVIDVLKKTRLNHEVLINSLFH